MSTEEPTPTLSPELVAALSDRLLEAERTGVPIEPLVGTIPAGDVDSAYLVQAASIATKVGDGRRVVGRKVGLTNPVVQVQLGVDQPDFGALFDDGAYVDGDAIPADAVLQAKVEAELAFVLGADLIGDEFTADDVAAAVGSVHAAIEIVGSRIENWQITIVDTIADNASGGGFVLGEHGVPLGEVDLTGCAMTLERSRADRDADDGGDGSGTELVSSGSGADCLGSPLIAATWLVNELARRGDHLRRGDVVLTGALGPMVGVEPGDRFAVTISGVGTVAASFT